MMDELREEREELAQIQRDDLADRNEAAAERAYWADEGLDYFERVTLEAWRWSR